MTTGLIDLIRWTFQGARRLSTPQENKHSLRGAVGKVGLEPTTPNTEKQADGFSHLLHSVLRLGSCQWNRVVADATAAPRLMVPARPPTPCKSTKSRLPDAEKYADYKGSPLPFFHFFHLIFFHLLFAPWRITRLYFL